MSAWDALPADDNVPSRVMAQVNDLGISLMRLVAFHERGSPHAPAGALDAAHMVLCLAAATPVDEDEATIRHEAVTDALSALARVGLGHIRELVAAALDHDVVAARLVRGTATVQ